MLCTAVTTCSNTSPCGGHEMEMAGSGFGVGGGGVVQPHKNRYPHCILWSPLPPITWILPFIGHTAIANSEGVIYDFAGPYTIGVEDMAFGAPTRYIQLNPEECSNLSWDEGVEEGCRIYSKRMHNICCDNCHSHVAQCLNLMNYRRYNRYGMIWIGVWLFFCGKFVSPWAAVKTYLPFTCLVILLLWMTGRI